MTERKVKDENFVIYWSHYSYYKKCPRKFLWKWGWKDIDLGSGPGQPKEIPEKSKKSEHYLVMGKAIQYGVEKFYNDFLWRDPATLIEKLKEIVNKKLKSLVDSSYINWNESPPLIKLEIECEEAILGFLKTVQKHTLVDVYSVSEVFMLGFIDDQTPIGAYIDILIKREDGTIILLDGKNSKAKDKFLEKEQLVYYALTLKVKEGVYPNYIGWIYYKFPYNEETGEEGIKILDLSEGEVNVLAQDIINVRKDIVANKFDPIPKTSNCNFCDFSKLCDKSTLLNKKPREKSKKEEDFLKSVVKDGGFFEL